LGLSGPFFFGVAGDLCGVKEKTRSKTLNVLEDIHPQLLLNSKTGLLIYCQKIVK